MQFKLKRDMLPWFSPIEQVLFNRGIEPDDFLHYLHTTDQDINEPSLFGEAILNAAKILCTAIVEDRDTWVIVDCDCDGMTSSALLINYLHRSFPAWVENHVKWFLHSDKQHGLSDFDYKSVKAGDLIVCPDSSSNDYEIHQAIVELGGQVIVLDHHEAEKISEYACVVNNQLSDYPNKQLSGVGVTWQFCRCLDSLYLNKNNTNDYLDLVAIGLIGDMQDIRIFETKHLIEKGLEPENLHNPFLYELAFKNKFSLGDKITPIGAAFYIVPFINSMMRSGTLEEKKLLFESMLDFKAFENIPSTKRGHKPDETETVVAQAVRVATNVKSRQTKAQDSSMELLEQIIEEQNMLDDKVLIFYLKPDQIDKNIAGLCANKLMAKYQRPCCILTQVDDTYQGSARGYTKTGFLNFKGLCSVFDDILYCEGHANAFGLGIMTKSKETFRDFLNDALKDLPTEILYYVDFIYDNVHVNTEQILDIARYDSLWGQELEEPLVAIHNLKIPVSSIQIKSPYKNPTLVITLNNGVELIKFKFTEEEKEDFFSHQKYIYLDIVGKCQTNEWGGRVTPQIKIEDYAITGSINIDF